MLDKEEQYYQDLEKKWRINLKKEENEFLEEFLMDDENREWAKGRRKEYLRNKWIELSERYLKLIKIKSHKWFEELVFDEYITPIKKKMSKIKRELDLIKNPVFSSSITDEMVEQAKQYPIKDLLGEPIMNKYTCLWHNDKHPSMHYYEATNTLHCFSCLKSGDAIDVYMQLNNCDFIEAVKKLN